MILFVASTPLAPPRKRCKTRGGRHGTFYRNTDSNNIVPEVTPVLSYIPGSSGIPNYVDIFRNYSIFEPGSSSEIPNIDHEQESSNNSSFFKATSANKLFFDNCFIPKVKLKQDPLQLRTIIIEEIICHQFTWIAHVQCRKRSSS